MEQDRVRYNAFIVGLRYFYILFFIVLFTLYRKEVTPLTISLILLYITNHQIRTFQLGHLQNKWPFTTSLIIEVILAYSLFRQTNYLCASLFLSTLIDLLLSFPIGYAIGYLVGVLALVGRHSTLEEILFILAQLLPVFLLLVGIRQQRLGKIEAEALYDELRKKEEALQQANRELQAYANTVEEVAVLRERNRISREIHDNVGHALSTMIIQLGAITQLAKQGKSQEIGQMAEGLSAFAKKSMEDVRCAVRAMRPREFEENEEILLISELIKNFKKLTNIDVQMSVSEDKWKLNADQAMAIYRIVQEFLSNALKHGKATSVNIFFNFTQEGLRIYLKDNGVGCKEVKYGVGLKSMNERLIILGGHMTYKTEEKQGFELVVYLEKGKLSIDET